MAASGPANRARMTNAHLRTGCAGVLRISMLMNATESPENTNHTSIAPDPVIENLQLRSGMPGRSSGTTTIQDTRAWWSGLWLLRRQVRPRPNQAPRVRNGRKRLNLPTRQWREGKRTVVALALLAGQGRELDVER